MESMKNGDLAAHLKAQHPTRSLQLSWFRQMVSTLARIHDSHVFVEDTARKNFLLSDDLSVKLCDFTEATILPLDADMKAAGDCGYSIYTDIGQLDATIYQVITGPCCEF
ncbi:hypothetical protein GX48_05283 [Paracoccidioides brasiliensis]|nr:hypothetical protein GX48_05283 [Paracoccidioides brasiliensis]